MKEQVFINKVDKKILKELIKELKSYEEEVKDDTIKLIDELFYSYGKITNSFDIILVLGGKREHRAITASKLSLKYNKPVIMSGGAYNKKFKMTESSYYKQIALNYGVNPDKIFVENDSTNTYENFLYSFDKIKKIIKKETINILVVSNSIHLPRSLFVGNNIIANNKLKFKLIPFPSDNSKNNKLEWMKHRIARESIVIEMEKIIKYMYNDELNNKFDRLDNKMKELLEEKVFPGATYAIVDSNFSKEGVCGNRSLMPIEENSLDTLYDMASLTKVIVTNTITLRAIQAGKMDINDKISKYLDYDFDITVYDLLTHQSGLQPDLDNQNMKSHQDFVDELKNIKLQYTPRSKCVYSCVGFIFLGMILEKVYNKPLDEIAKEEVFIPLEMKRATFKSDVTKSAPTELTINRGLVRGKVHDESAYYSEKALGNAGLFCDINDASKFVKMILNDGKVKNGIYLDKKYIDMLFDIKVRDLDGFGRSTGWLVGKNNITGDKVSDNTISHTGFTGTSIVIDRDNNLGIIILSNRVHPTRDNRLLIDKRKEIISSVYENIKVKKLIK